MPMYPYDCESCNHRDDEFQKMEDPHLIDCPKCRQPSYKRRPCLAHTSHKEYSKPIEMFSIALDHEDEIREFQRRNPEAQISTNRNDPLFGVPIARSRHEKLAILEKEGYQEKT